MLMSWHVHVWPFPNIHSNGFCQTITCQTSGSAVNVVLVFPHLDLALSTSSPRTDVTIRNQCLNLHDYIPAIPEIYAVFVHSYPNAPKFVFFRYFLLLPHAKICNL